MSSTTNLNSVVLVDTIPLLHSCLAEIARTVSLAVDLEGVALCRSGTLCIVQLKAAASDTIWLVDVVALGASAFEETGGDGKSLKAIFEDEAVKKLFFDVRNDSDALFHLFGVKLANTYDLQLLEVAVRASTLAQSPRFVRGLVPSLEEHVAPTKAAAVVRRWARVKADGLALFAPEHGGTYEVFAARPLAQALVEYCAQDVALLHDLEAAMSGRIGRRGWNWEQRVREESKVRVAVAYQANYNPRGREKALVPKNW
ncbi:ribonuclease H-like domain-containing protein [Mycena pura]|uniref:Ribonuclease H-like domain-containing protein n=1 Tax=Mycena pura TaxID=153505 RepID=A0AAD6VUZ9_9AGAR|nr:ribonuclease H-like domain-containing protein [Mycena pura]